MSVWSSASPRALGHSGLVYGICVGPANKLDHLALPALREIDPSAPVLLRRDQTSIHIAYNSMMDEALAMGARGLVLIHDDVAIRNHQAPVLLESLLSDPSVAIVGAIGARQIHSIEWWWYDCRGFVEERELVVDFGRSTQDVDAVDGIVLGLSRAAMERLRFQPDLYPSFHGYDLEICSQARSENLRVVVTDLDVYHDSYPHGKITDPEAHRLADRSWRKRWRRGIRNRWGYRYAVARHALLRSPPKTIPRRLARVLRP